MHTMSESDDETSSNSSTGDDQKLGSLLHQGARVLVKHDYFDDGFLNAKWQGLFHLAYVEKGWNEEDGRFSIRWSRLVRD